MTPRRAITIALAIPYGIVMLPLWIVRDLAAGFRVGWRRSRGFIR